MALYAATDRRSGKVRTEMRMLYVKVWDDDGGSFSVVSEHRGGGLLYNFIPASPDRLDDWRRGLLVYAADRDG